MSEMMKRYLTIFVFVTLAAMIAHQTFQLPFGEVDFYENHGFFFLIAIALFPRLTLLFSSVASGGLLWWLGLVFCPRFLVACLATVTYLRTNPVLVTISWAMALSGESLEKWGLWGGTSRRGLSGMNIRFARYTPPHHHTEGEQAPPKPSHDDAIEVDFKRRD